jgi:hypothetical protein
VPAKYLVFALFLLASGCARAPGPGDGTFAGPVTPQPGNPTCQPTRGVLTIQGRHFQFEPNEGVITVQGSVAPDGKLAGETTTSGMDHHPFAIRFTGQVTGNEVTGSLVTPRCTSAVVLHPSERGLLNDLLNR